MEMLETIFWVQLTLSSLHKGNKGAARWPLFFYNRFDKYVLPYLTISPTNKRMDGNLGMGKSFTLEGNEYKIENLSEEGKKIWSHLFFALQSLDELNAKHALLMRAKNSYISDLKSEVVEKKSGVDLGALFVDD